MLLRFWWPLVKLWWGNRSFHRWHINVYSLPDSFDTKGPHFLVRLLFYLWWRYTWVLYILDWINIATFDLFTNLDLFGTIIIPIFLFFLFLFYMSHLCWCIFSHFFYSGKNWLKYFFCSFSDCLCYLLTFDLSVWYLFVYNFVFPAGFCYHEYSPCLLPEEMHGCKMISIGCCYDVVSLHSNVN